MNKISTAEETYTKITGCIINHKDVKDAMIEFAKLHVEAALKEASENAEQKWIKFTENDYEIDKDSILNAYPLENIK